MLASIDLQVKLKSLFRYFREIPLAWFVLGLAIARISIFLSRRVSGKRRAAWMRLCAVSAGLVLLVIYLVLTLDSLRCFMIQLDEANILSISAASLRGLPMYHPPVSPDFTYSLVYGPLTFLIYSLALLGGGIYHFWILHLTVAAAAIASCAALYLLLRRFVPVTIAAALLAFPLSILLQHPEIFLSIRADLWIVLFAALAILSSFLETELLAILLTGIFGGLMIGLKISAAPAILFPFLVLYRRFGLRAPAYSLLPLFAVTFAPFALPNISLANYIAWIAFTRSEGLNAASAFSNLLYAFFLISPCLLVELYLRRFGLAFRNRIPELSVIALGLLLAVLTSKTGSGVYYLWHIVPALVVYLAMAVKDMSQVPNEERSIPVYSIAVACTLFACVNVPRAFGYIRTAVMPPGVAVAQQSIDKYLDLYRDRSSVQMGYGSIDSDYRPALRYVLIYKGQPYRFDGNTGRFDTALLPFPANVLHQMSTCTNDVWLVPHAQAPFQLWVLPDSLRSIFLQNYRIDRTDGVYDAWVCHHAKR